MIPNCGIMMGYKKSISMYCKTIEENFEKSNKGPTGDTIIFFKCLKENKFDSIDVQMDYKDKLFFTLNNQTFVRYSNFMKSRQPIRYVKEENTFKYEKLIKNNSMIIHITDLSHNKCKRNVYGKLHNYYCNDNEN